MNNDLTFFTNEKDSTLRDRFFKVLKHVKYFDVLVGYFRSSGFLELYKSLENIEKIRILVGLNIDKRTYDVIDESKFQEEFDFEAADKTREAFSSALQNELDESGDDINTELGIRKFIDFIKTGKLEIRAYPSQNIHAKVYISRFPDDHFDYGRVITGSSNFSQTGLVANREFNVELKNKADVEFALNQFENLWLEGVDITTEYIQTVENKSWLNDNISPYLLYLKFLYEYFKEDINVDYTVTKYLPKGFLELEYQSQSATSAKKILDTYNGVFLADVVGLGKTFTSALLAQQLIGKILVICPPVLKSYWEDTFFEFGVRQYEVVSIGKIEKIAKSNKNYDYIFIDEAHRFRNEYTFGYEELYKICVNKKVILVSATPLNNSIQDIFSLLKLFQVPKKSTIPGISNLEAYFSHFIQLIKKAKKISPEEHIKVIRDVSERIRHDIFSHIMVRRTRSDVIKYYSKDMKANNLSFPELTDPKRFIYKFEGLVENVFKQTIELLKDFNYSRYVPLIYLKEKPEEFELQSQRNIGGFMKGILVKRLESSFFAFKMSLSRFIESYSKYIEMYKNGKVYISKKVNVYDFLDNDDEEDLLKLVDLEKAKVYDSDEFISDYLPDLEKDLAILVKLQDLWKNVKDDPKLNQFIKDLKNDNNLKNKKIIVFTESKETGDYLYESLNSFYKEKVILYSSIGGVLNNEKISPSVAKDIIKENYDPNLEPVSQKDKIKVLITTDVLAEGINLHRSNVVINYDLPWNPTRVMQRIGRVNRVGSKFDKVYIYNFFPTSQSDEHLGLEENIISKIQAFHNTLGEDSKYLTEDEAPESKELMGNKLYKKLSSKSTYEGEEEDERSELEYLQVIREIRDKKPELFKKIKKLPKKARTAKSFSKIDNSLLVSFFRKGMLKKFYVSGDKSDETKEITFFDAVDLLKSSEKDKKADIPNNYFELLKENKDMFEIATNEEFHTVYTPTKGGSSNVKFLIQLLKTPEIRNFDSFTEDEDKYLKLILTALQEGTIPLNTSKRIAGNIKKMKDFSPLKVLGEFKKNVADSTLYQREDNSVNSYYAKREIILSEYLVKGE